MCNDVHVVLLKDLLNNMIDPLLIQTTTTTVVHNSNSAPRYHPITGLPETRLAFEYVDLWLSMTRTSDIYTSGTR